MKHAQLKQPIVIIIEPLIVCWRLISPLCCGLVPLSLTQNSSKIGPFISVIIIAPPTVATVPTILAWLLMLLILTFSSLKKYVLVYRNFTEKERKMFGFCLFDYLRIQAITKVMAGRILHMAAAKVAVVYFIPKKYKFWSITGLPKRVDIKFYVVGELIILSKIFGT